MKINAVGVPSGTYSLVLESVDTNSALPDLVLKTDIVTISYTPEAICGAGSLIPPSAIAPMETEIGATHAVTFIFLEIKDTGSSLNGDETGLTNCGPRIY